MHTERVVSSSSSCPKWTFSLTAALCARWTLATVFLPSLLPSFYPSPPMRSLNAATYFATRTHHFVRWRLSFSGRNLSLYLKASALLDALNQPWIFRLFWKQKKLSLSLFPLDSVLFVNPLIALISFLSSTATNKPPRHPNFDGRLPKLPLLSPSSQWQTNSQIKVTNRRSKSISQVIKRILSAYRSCLRKRNAFASSAPVRPASSQWKYVVIFGGWLVWIQIKTFSLTGRTRRGPQHRLLRANGLYWRPMEVSRRGWSANRLGHPFDHHQLVQRDERLHRLSTSSSLRQLHAQFAYG